MDVSEILHACIAQAGAHNFVVITGGEPFRQNIEPLVKELIERGFKVQIETNGTLPPPRGYAFFEMCSKNTRLHNACFIVCSPKTGKINPVLEDMICAYKYVVSDGGVMDDGLPRYALGHTASPAVARPPKDYWRPIYIQPVDEKDEGANKLNTEAAVASVMKHGYTLQLQTHKIINME